MSVYGPPSRVVSGWDKNGRPTSLFDSTQRLYGTDRGSARDMTVAAFPRADGIECSRRQAHLELLLRSAKGLEAYARRRKYQSQVPLARVVSRLAKLIKGAPFADRSHRRDQARKTVDAYILEAQRILAYARQQFDQGRPSAAIQRVADLEKRHRDPWRPATQHARDRARPLFTRECPRNRESTDYVVTRCIPRAATAVHAPQHSDMEIAGNTRHYTGREMGDSSSLQHECSARARAKEFVYASRALREMIARPKISRNDWNTAERGAFEVGNFAPFSRPGTTWTSSTSPAASSAATARRTGASSGPSSACPWRGATRSRSTRSTRASSGA
jgi:hypothetical protein